MIHHILEPSQNRNISVLEIRAYFDSFEPNEMELKNTESDGSKDVIHFKVQV